jgi:UDP-2-acetamido-3-amino-2,3-dideoxy-glucuronate N-acetyltransferase
MPGYSPSSFPDVQIHESAWIDEPCEIGAGTRIWHFSHVMQGARIGPGCNLGQNVVISPGVVIGRNVKIQNNVSVYSGVILEDDVFCGPSMVFTNVTTPRSEIPRRDQYVETRVERGASLGANCTVVCGVRVGRFALVGAGAVVTRDVQPYELVTGVPARRTGWVCRCGITLSEPDEAGRSTCHECGNEYRRESPLAGGNLVPVKEMQ